MTNFNIEDHKAVISTDCVVMDFEEKKVLLIERKNEPHGWCFPGGLLDSGEEIQDCAYRELQEETGLNAIASTFITMMDAPERDPRGRTISFVYMVDGWTGEAEASDDALSVRWVSWDEALQIDLCFDHNEILETVLEFVKMWSS